MAEGQRSEKRTIPESKWLRRARRWRREMRLACKRSARFAVTETGLLPEPPARLRAVVVVADVAEPLVDAALRVPDVLLPDVRLLLPRMLPMARMPIKQLTLLRTRARLLAEVAGAGLRCSTAVN